MRKLKRPDFLSPSKAQTMAREMNYSLNLNSNQLKKDGYLLDKKHGKRKLKKELGERIHEYIYELIQNKKLSVSEQNLHIREKEIINSIKTSYQTSDYLKELSNQESKIEEEVCDKNKKLVGIPDIITPNEIIEIKTTSTLPEDENEYLKEWRFVDWALTQIIYQEILGKNKKFQFLFMCTKKPFLFMYTKRIYVIKLIELNQTYINLVYKIFYKDIYKKYMESRFSKKSEPKFKTIRLSDINRLLSLKTKLDRLDEEMQANQIKIIKTSTDIDQIKTLDFAA